MANLHKRNWVPEPCEQRVQQLAQEAANADIAALSDRIDRLIEENRQIHERDCFNLNPATNVMNPRAEAVLAAGLGSRPSLGYPGDKYEMGLEAIEEIEVICAELCAEVFEAGFCGDTGPPPGPSPTFMASWQPANRATRSSHPPPPSAGTSTHHKGGCAGLYGLDIHPAPVNA